MPGTSRSTRRALRLVAATSALLVLLASCSSDDEADGSDDSVPEVDDAAAALEPFGPDGGVRTAEHSESGELTIESSSTRAEMVSGGDVLLTVSGPALEGAGEDELTVTAGDEDVSDAFEPGDAVDGLEQGAVWRGLVTDLPDGQSEVTAAVDDEQVTLSVTSHPITGPVFSGPHLEPWTCTAEGLGMGPTDQDCSADTVTTWQYQNTDGELVPLEDPTVSPPDVDTTTIDGEEVPLIVRSELATIDRGVASIWTLDPNPDPEGAWDPSGWNDRLVYRFGGGCGTQYSQGSNLGPALDMDLLVHGYALATNTLDTFQTACNDVLSAEAALMTREHFVEQYGVPRFTIGDGGSGGAIQQLLIANAYPGLLDALSPSAPFPDAISISGGVTDCGLLLSYYETTEAGAQLGAEQQAAINGHLTAGTCSSWRDLFLGAVDPTDGCSVDQAEVYDPDTNPDGVRCTLQDINVNVMGRDPDTGFARRPLANEGVQYGLQALGEGTITVDDFLDLNEQVGGYDIDGTIVDERTDADPDAIARAYETGRVSGQGPLLDVPIILRNGYTDDVGDIHTRFHSFSIRERLRVDGEDDPNLALWTSGGNVAAALLGSQSDNEPVRLLDEWITAAHDDERDVPWRERLADARPDDADNRCIPPTGPAIEGGWEVYDEPGPCADAFPSLGDPRTASGAPLADDVLACQLVPVDEAVAADGYPVALTDGQVERLEAIFPDGVCDWSQPGIGQQAPSSTWLTYE